MKTITLVTLAVITIILVMGAPPLLANNNQFLQQASATHMDTATSNEKTILHQGIIASGKPPQKCQS